MTDELAARLRTSFNARDIDTFRALLAEDARWGEDPEAPSTCHSRSEIIAHLKRLLDGGVRATIVETATGPRGVACVLEVEWPDSEPSESQRPDHDRIYQAYLVTNGLVSEIQGHESQEAAWAAIAG